jgi:RimJ/RimL family protein N-acetyltransferase
MVDPYFLRTARLGFRTWTFGDIELAKELWGDARVTLFIGGPFTARQVEERLAREIAAMLSGGVQYWPVFRLSDGAHVGCCGLRPYRLQEGVFEIGFHVRFEHWHRGYASEAARAVVGYGFEKVAARSLFAGHHPNNDDSRRILLRLGFRYTHNEFYPATASLHPSYLLTREDYERGIHSMSP